MLVNTSIRKWLHAYSVEFEELQCRVQSSCYKFLKREFIDSRCN